MMVVTAAVRDQHGLAWKCADDSAWNSTSQDNQHQQGGVANGAVEPIPVDA
jgi:hypothetical protein